MIDISKIRKSTPGCFHHIHFNNAGASLPDESTLETVKSYLDEEAIVGGYELMEKKSLELEQVYHSIAKMINAKRQEISIFQNATSSWTAALNAISFENGAEVLCSEVEYGSNYLNLLRQQKNKDLVIKIIPSEENGGVDLEALEGMMNPKVKLIAITHVPSNGGLVNPVAQIGRIAKKYDCLYLIDACQSIGQLPIDVKELNCDFLSATGRKYLRAPRGTGFLFSRESILSKLDPQVLDLSSATWDSESEYTLQSGAQRFEVFENSKALQMGLGAAIDFYLDLGPENIYLRIKKLADKLREGLNSISKFECLDLGEEKCGIVTFRHAEYDAKKIKDHLMQNGIATSVSTPGTALIDAKKRNLTFINRASVHYYNTEEEIDELLKTLKTLNE